MLHLNKDADVHGTARVTWNEIERGRVVARLAYTLEAPGATWPTAGARHAGEWAWTYELEAPRPSSVGVGAVAIPGMPYRTKRHRKIGVVTASIQLLRLEQPTPVLRTTVPILF
jgi:hypothetical protein